MSGKKRSKELGKNVESNKTEARETTALSRSARIRKVASSSIIIASTKSPGKRIALSQTKLTKRKTRKFI